jgi:GNAT superfamily N-acetyltransferase
MSVWLKKGCAPLNDGEVSASPLDDEPTHQVSDYVLVERLPSAADYNLLRQTVGWGGYKQSEIETSLPRSLYGVCVYQDDTMVGMARVIGDGGLVFYIQDVIVVPAHQRRGIGRLMMDRAMAYIRAHAHQNSVIGLMAAKGKEPFYEAYGFTPRPNDRLGCGMTLFWKAE